MNSILGPNGQRLVELGGDRAWRTRVKGDIVVSFQWIQLDDIDDQYPTPCMCLFPAARHMETAAYVIPQRNAHVYATSRGEQSPALLGLAFKAAVHMGFFPDRATVFRIMDILLENIPDLVRMPSDQPGALNLKRLVHGIEASAAINGKTIHEEVI